MTFRLIAMTTERGVSTIMLNRSEVLSAISREMQDEL